MNMKTSTLFVSAILSGLFLAALNATAQITIFNDNFSTSTLNSATPAAPTASSTSYQAVSTEALTVSTIASGHLDLSFGTGSGNGYQAQALFATSPVTLTTIGDYLQLEVTFTDTGGFLTTANGTLNIGMYNSGQVGPLAGGVANENSANTDHFTGGAENWMGYTAQVVTNHTMINLRNAQTGTGNNNQDVAFGGTISTTKGYNNPFSSLGSNNSGAYLTLDGQYTMVLTYQLNGVNSLAITSSLYSGAGTGGAQLALFSDTASGANYLTNSFDALAFGFYGNKTQNSAIDLNQIEVNDLIQPLPEPGPAAVIAVGLLLCSVHRIWKRSRRTTRA